jgi:hypothetical protein
MTVARPVRGRHRKPRRITRLRAWLMRLLTAPAPSANRPAREIALDSRRQAARERTWGGRDA